MWSVAVEPKGRWVAVGDYSNLVTVYDSASGDVIAKHRLDWFIWSVSFSLDSRALAVACWDKTARVYPTSDAVNPEDETTPSLTPWNEAWRVTRTDRVFSVSLSRDATILAVGGRDNLVAVYRLRWPGADADNGAGETKAADNGGWGVAELILELPHLNNRVYSVSMHPDGHAVAFGGVAKEVLVWNIQCEIEVQRLYTGANVQSVEYSPDGSAIAAGGEAKEMQVWHEFKGCLREERSLTGGKHPRIHCTRVGTQTRLHKHARHARTGQNSSATYFKRMVEVRDHG